jgi:hypothetical protein
MLYYGFFVGCDMFNICLTTGWSSGLKSEIEFPGLNRGSEKPFLL